MVVYLPLLQNEALLVTRHPYRTAIIYDFDGTLARGNIQERGFIPAIGKSPGEFWSMVKERAEKEDADEVLIYMLLMMELSQSPIRREELREHGKSAALFNGLSGGEWFRRINQYAHDHGLALDHYVISSGNFEMIEGCPIFECFRKVFASRYVFDDNGNAKWPSVAINYTTKTQYLFRINKGIDNNWNNEKINSFVPEAERPVPFKRMIFIGDGDTDIPAMKMTTFQGGHSIAVYDPKRETQDMNKIHRLIAQDRVNFVAPADYDVNSPLDVIIKGILGRIARESGATAIERAATVA